jgi:RHS repeat-associated protein
MTQYKFNVGSNAVTGALTWNPNGTLGQLAITDQLNSSNAQTCNYTHDDLTRIASANCGSIWSQTFTFDPFGNITKTGNSSFNPSYSAATNRMTQIGSQTPTYDSNGNVTNDFLHTYAWDANGRPVTIDGIGATYDALGRMVELNRSGVYSQIVYAPSGSKLALMNVQSLSKAFVPLTGGATAVYLSTGLAYYRHSDWLGSSRLATTTTQTMYSDVAYAPYGETYAQAGTADFSFTGMNEDVEQNANPATLYDFLAREYGIQGRWPSPDPAGLLAVDPSNPQSWNRYAYVMNNPLALTDPTGMDGESGGWCSDTLSCIIEAIVQFFSDILGFLFGPPPIPQAAPAPPGGYGAGIDPYGTWDEKLPAGVQVFPSSVTGIPNGSGCTYGQGSCGGMIYGFDDNNVMLKKASDFSAGFGDIFTFGGTYVIRKYVYCHCDDVVDKHSGAYITGGVTAVGFQTAMGATGGAVAEGKYGTLFGRGGRAAGGFFNRGLVRFGWYWDGVKDAIGLRIGPAGTFHIPFWYP